jgi:hypothetical protein
MNDVSHEYKLTGCRLIMVAGRKPRLFEISNIIGAYSHKEIKYDVISRATVFESQEMADSVKKTLGHNIKELSKIYY